MTMSISPVLHQRTKSPNPIQNERSILKREHDAHQQHQQQQQRQPQPIEEEVSLTEELEQENLKVKEMLAMKNAALSRQDIKVQVDETEAQAPNTNPENKNALKQEDVKQVKRTLNSAYQTQEQKPKSKLSEWS